MISFFRCYMIKLNFGKISDILFWFLILEIIDIRGDCCYKRYFFWKLGWNWFCIDKNCLKIIYNFISYFIKEMIKMWLLLMF